MENRSERAARADCGPAFAAALLFAAVVTTLGGEERPRYLPAGQPEFAALLAPPPPLGSAEDAADLAQVVAVSRACTSNEIALAFSEKKFSLFNFSRATGGLLQRGKLPATGAFFERVQQEAEKVTDLAKEYWKRPRPYTLEPSLASGKLETSSSYPSGHSTEGTVVALVLADLLPDRREEILAVGRDLGWHRVWIARHYPTDIYAGRVLAQAIVRELKSSPAFQRDFAQVKSEIERAKRGQKETAASLWPAAAN